MLAIIILLLLCDHEDIVSEVQVIGVIGLCAKWTVVHKDLLHEGVMWFKKLMFELGDCERCLHLYVPSLVSFTLV